MQRIKDFILQLKQNKYFPVVLKGLFIVLYAFLFMKTILNLGYVSESVFQVFKDYYYAYAMIYFLVSVALLQRVNVKNWIIYPFIVIYWIVAAWWLKSNEMNWGVDLQNAYRMRWICGGIGGVLLIDMIRYKKIASLKERSLLGSIFFMVAAVVSLVITKGTFYTYVLFIPFIVLYLLRVKKEDFKQWIFAFTLGYYGAFLYIMIKSFIEVPYTGERYYGIYINHGLFGIFIGGAFVCALWWIILLREKELSLWKRILTYIPLMFPAICCVINGARVAELAVIVVSIVAFCIWKGNADKKQIAFRFLTVGIFAVIAIVLFVMVLYFLKDYDRESLENIIQNEVLREKILYWCGRGKTFFNEESRYGILESGTIINAIDRFSSGRLSYWVIYLRDLNLFGHEGVYIELGEYVFSHPHNTFVYWLYGMGIIPGIALLVWIGSYIWRSVKKAVRNQSEYILSFLWVVYFAVASLNEDIFWVYIAAFVLLILQYPLLMSVKDNNEKERQ